MNHKRPIYLIYLAILLGYGFIGWRELYSNVFALYFAIGSLLFLFSSLSYHLSNLLFDFAEGNEKHLFSYLQDIASGMAGGFIVAILGEFKGSSLTSLSYWLGIPIAIGLAMIFLVLLGIPYIDLGRIKEGKESKSKIIKEEIKNEIF